ncbi:conserved oligomeric golgi complex component 5 [Holotrichia oblita]|uniref:Conserved oligomeric golgi complex component 5 n=1 Tax=Holotrichia oblita TaxID=644536 RepID=A0ACB9TF40_HOLOL|nr:conserved oligomeric golgi complex component 5 [Holotrichia oblita]
MEDSLVIADIKNDDFFGQFLPSAAKNTLQSSMSIAEQVTKLGEGIDRLTKELNKHILLKHGDLLRQANHATQLQEVLNTMNAHVQNLFANAERLKMQIHRPYHSLEQHTRILGRLHLASHILRQVNRIQQLNRRLSNTNDYIQKASILQELEQIAADTELSDIDALAMELRNIREQRQQVYKVATNALNKGTTSENIAQTTNALQIFHNMGMLTTSLESAVNIALSECRESLKTSFDLTGNLNMGTAINKVGPGKATLSTSQGFRQRVWTDLEKAFSEEIYSQCKRVKFLDSTLNNISIMVITHLTAQKFWDELGKCIEEEIRNASPAVQQLLEEDYPQLLKCYCEMTKKLNFNTYSLNRNIFEKCENAYLSNSLNRILEPTQAMFNKEGVAPSHDEIDSLIRTITNELSVTLVEDRLNEKVAKNVVKGIKMYAVKTEQQLASGGDAAQVIVIHNNLTYYILLAAGAPNAGQQFNIQLANAMYYFHTQIQRIVANMKDTLPLSVVSLIIDSLSALDNLTSAIIEPITGSIKMAIETILITIHAESDWAKYQVSGNRPTIPCSFYMRELVEFITRTHNIYLTPFDNKDILNIKCNSIVIRSIELLVRHSSLLRPISMGGRLRLQSDYNYLEQALKIICPNLSDLANSYRLLKSMSYLITSSPADLVASQISGSTVPHTTAFLLLFTHAGSELLSPHQTTGWTIQQFSDWLDEHPSESDRFGYN